MSRYQVTCSELVYVDRTYEIEADSPESASAAIRSSQGDAGELIDEQVQDGYEFCGVIAVHDENGEGAESP
jgi:hypothetical protein